MIIFKKLLRFNIFIFFLLLMVPAPAVYGEIITEGAYSFDPIDYIIEGETMGCGIQITALNKKKLYVDSSLNLNISKDKRSNYNIFKVTAKEVAILGEQIAPRDVYVNHGWIKTSPGTSFLHQSLIRGENNDHFMAVNSDIKNVIKILAEINLGNLKMGFNREAGKYDKVFELPSPPSASTQDKINSCLEDLLKTMEKYNSKQK